MSKGKPLKLWAVYKIGKTGKRTWQRPGGYGEGSAGQRAEGVREDGGREKADLSPQSL